MNRNCQPYNKRMRRLFALICLLWLPLAASAVTGTGDKISISVQHTGINEIFEMLSRQSRVNILLGKGVEGEVSVNLYDVNMDTAIHAVATAGGFAVERSDNSYFITKRDEVGKDIAGGLTRMKAIRVQYSKPRDVEEILKKHLSRHGKITTLEEQKILVVEDLPDFVSRIETLVTELDRQPTQILIEARILEVALTDEDAYGIDWSKFIRSSGGTGAFGVQGLATPGAPGLFFSFINDNISIALDALRSNGRVRTLSTPKLLTLEHKEAEVIIGDRLGYKVTTTINQVTSESVAFIESGVILKVTTFVDHQGRIMLDIHPEVSTGSVTDGIPSITTTEVSTQLLAEDGQTIFIGGLIRNSVSESTSGVPVLGDIPVVGKLFSNKSNLTLDSETIVLITPRIIHDAMDLYDINDESRVRQVDKDLKDHADEINQRFEPAAETEKPLTEADRPVSSNCQQHGPVFMPGQDCRPPPGPAPSVFRWFSSTQKAAE